MHGNKHIWKNKPAIQKSIFTVGWWIWNLGHKIIAQSQCIFEIIAQPQCVCVVLCSIKQTLGDCHIPEVSSGHGARATDCIIFLSPWPRINDTREGSSCIGLILWYIGGVSTYQTLLRVGGLIKGHALQDRQRHKSCGVGHIFFWETRWRACSCDFGKIQDFGRRNDDSRFEN